MVTFSSNKETILFFFFCFPSYISGGSAYVTAFFNPTIEAVTFHLYGRCMLSVFLLPAFIPLGHGLSGSFKSMRWNACVHRPDLSLYSHPKEFWGNRVRNHVNSKGKILSTRSLEEDQTCDTASGRTASPTHYWLNLLGLRSTQLYQH